jgi:hypothetical protein
MTITTTAQRYLSTITICILVAFAVGRYSVQSPSTKVKETDNKTTQQQTAKDTHTKTTITIVKQSDGATKTVETIDTSITAHTTTEQQDKLSLQQTTTPPKTQPLNLSVLASVNPIKGEMQPVYGASITKQLLGPVSVGLFGLTNGTMGVSIGLNF